MQEAKSLLSPEFQTIVDVLMLLQRTHAELLQIYDDAINKINGGVYGKRRESTNGEKGRSPAKTA